jgi:hypothetical protein
MTDFAIVDPAAQRIETYVAVPQGMVVLPVLRTADPVGEQQVPGDPVVTVSAEFVTIHTPAVRALSGKVAILNDANEIEAIRDLGGELVQVADNVRAFVERNAQYDAATQIRTGPQDRIGKALVERVWTVRDMTEEEKAERVHRRAVERVREQFGSRGIKAAFEQENRMRLLEGVDPFTSIEAFIDDQIAKGE